MNINNKVKTALTKKLLSKDTQIQISRIAERIRKSDSINSLLRVIFQNLLEVFTSNFISNIPNKVLNVLKTTFCNHGNGTIIIMSYQ